MIFQDKLNKIVKKNNSLLCIGLDPEIEKLPRHLLKNADPLFKFNKTIIDNTFYLVCAYKPNIAFYEAHGAKGLKALKKTIEYLKKEYANIPIILDAKRADIGNTARMYARALYGYWQADATTVYPYLGLDSLLPFLEYKDKLTILLVKTSNKDAGTFQDLTVANEPFYVKLAKGIKKWRYPNIGLFVGATYPKELGMVRKLFPKTAILTAGIGAQEAETEKTIKFGVDANGNNLICNAGRSIIYADHSPEFGKAARLKTLETRNLINKYRKNKNSL